MADAGVTTDRARAAGRRRYRTRINRRLKAEIADLKLENARLLTKIEYLELDLRTERCMQQKVAQRMARA